MVSTHWGGLVARATYLLSHNVERAKDPALAQNALAATKALQAWYDNSTGLWTTSGWWNSANCLTVLGDWAVLDGSGAAELGLADILANTFNNAQTTPAVVQKSIAMDSGRITSTYSVQARQDADGSLAPRGFSHFLNDFYDDEGWWALGWIRAWDLTRTARYLDMAQFIFDDMKNGTDGRCGGGIWWSKEKKYKNAIANELYLSLAASLANRVPNLKDYYLDIAKREWAWFQRSGMINADNLINDGLRINDDGTCVNNGMRAWSYNQGVVLGGLVELAKATGDKSYLDEATKIAKAAVTLLADENGIIRESDRCEPNCGGDGSQFKGVFVRNLHYLQKEAPRKAFRDAIKLNADSIWAKNRNTWNQLGVSWSGPVEAGGGPNATTHTSAMDVLVAALAVV